MSRSSTPSEAYLSDGNESINGVDDTIVGQVPGDSGSSMVTCLMERLRKLEESHQRTVQQLLDSEVKRAQLQDELSARKAAAKTPSPTVGASIITQRASEPMDVASNGVTTVTGQPNSIPSAANAVSVQQPAALSEIITPCHNTNLYSSQPSVSNNAMPPNTGCSAIPHTTFLASPYATTMLQNTASAYTNVGLPNMMAPNQGSLSRDSNVCTSVGGSTYGLPRKLHDLPEFHGHPEQWLVFIAAFRESSNAYGYTHLENTFRLQKALKGLAYDEVESLLIDPRNVPQAIEQLEFKYGRPELLIKSQLHKIHEIIPVHENQLERLVPFATKVQNLTTFLKSAKATQYISNPTLMEELVSKMPMSKRIEWATYSSVFKPFPTLEHFNMWVSQLARIIAQVAPTMSAVPIKMNPNRSRAQPKPVLAMNEINNGNTRMEVICLKCDGSHVLGECDYFLGMSIDERWDFVKLNRLCFSCLCKGHNLFQCRRKKSCKVDGCKKTHNPELHHKTSNSQVQVNTVQLEPSLPKTTKLLFKVLPVELCGPNNKILRVYAFLDEGSSATLIDESVAREMGIRNKRDQLTLQWFGGKATKISSMCMQFKIRGVNNETWYELKTRTVPKLELPSQSVNINELRRLEAIKDLPIAGYTDATPQLLIGLDHCHLIANSKCVQLDQRVLAANTKLGWVIYGQPMGTHSTTSCQVSHIVHTEEMQQENINDMIADYFTTENFGVAVPKQPIESRDTTRARNIMKNTTTRLDDRFETGLLWKDINVRLPDSYNMALRRLQAVENKMKNNDEFAEAYRAAVTNYISSGYARILTKSEVENSSPLTWYLPHFAVFNVNKPGKLRLVFDAAAAVNGTSLNSLLLKGPDESQSLLKVLYQFREGIVAVCADIKEMFLQIRVRKADQDAQRFLWRRDPKDEIEIYAMAVMIFGATCSPCCAQYVKNLNAIEIAKNQPEVIDAIINSHYVDDMVCSFQCEEVALRISSAVKMTHSKAGFELRGFISNSSYVQDQLNDKVRNQSTNVNMNTADSVEKVLGMFWENNTDEFIFKLHMNRVNPKILNGIKCPTKRELLCLVMSVYDPFGMLANLLVYGKILLQELWRTGIEWDEAIPQPIYARFTQWVGCLQLAKQFRLARCYSSQMLSAGTTIELHVFNDASETAFASVAYWRIITSKGISVSFVAGKTKCAPLKVLSVPRLELQAAVLGTHLKNSIVESHRVKPSRTVLWSDSRTVISWIQSDHRQYKPFVMHRVGEILESTHERDWRWLPTGLNAADVATRTTYPVKYCPENIWIRGPAFLGTDEDTWPRSIGSNALVNTEEEKRSIYLVTMKEQLIDFSRFSNYLRLQRTVGWVLRFADVARKKWKLHNKVYELSTSELRRAEMVVCGMVQREAYADEINELRVGTAVSKGSSISALTPRFKAEGIICVYGRIDYALALPDSTRHPIIMPNRHTVTELIVMWYHCKSFHQNDELVVNEVRRRYWIPNLRAAVKRAKSRCQMCKNNRAKPEPPLMGQLPADRLRPYVRPFTYTGLDYFGPIYVTIGRRTEKRWAALFTCLTIRAIHIELAADLSTDAAIICIRNFVNRRGVPMKIRSDMGTNFVGANGELQKVQDLFDHNFIQAELATKCIKWEFNCPANPSSGGCWERLIQSTKKVLAVTLKAKAPRVETLRSLLIEAENIVNSRPLTHLPVSHENPDPLTPNHFLLGTTNSTQTPGDGKPICMRKQYRISQQLKDVFWRQWIREYLPTLTKRTKWFTPQKPIEVSDIVIICDENAPRSEWRRGIVVSKITARDGQTRIVDIQTSKGVLRRPVSKLAVLEVYGEDPESLHGGRDVAEP